jgi:hypothetical protein
MRGEGGKGTFEVEVEGEEERQWDEEQSLRLTSMWRESDKVKAMKTFFLWRKEDGKGDSAHD